MINIYTDGACNSNQSGGWCCYSPELNMCWCNQKESTTNNEMELMAIKAALVLLYKSNIQDSSITIHSDSAWSIGAITSNWNIKIHADLVAQLKNMLALLELRHNVINFNKVSGHSGIAGNEMCDTFAVILSNL